MQQEEGGHSVEVHSARPRTRWPPPSLHLHPHAASHQRLARPGPLTFLIQKLAAKLTSSALKPLSPWWGMLRVCLGGGKGQWTRLVASPPAPVHPS